MSIGADRITDKAFTTRSEVIASARHGGDQSSLATQIALEILREGGSAVDAAIAANAALGLMEPTGNGIGGDLFAIVWDADKKALHGLNASGRSPQSLTLQYFRDNGYEAIPPLGPLPVSVPGTVDGWFELHRALRPSAHDPSAGAGYPLRSRGLPGYRGDRLLLAA